MDFKEALDSVMVELQLPYQLKVEQEKAVKSICRGGHVLAMLPTGFGKSDIFILPPLIMNKVRIV